MNDAYMPAPSRNAARLVVHTPRMRIIVMSISGLLAAHLDRDPDARDDEARRASRPSVFGEPQPQVVVSLTATSTVEMPIVISAAASQLMRPGTRTGDSGMKRQVATAASSDRDQRHPEQPVVVEVLDDHAGEHDADARADAEDRRQQADAAGDLLARELVADDAEREREDAAGGALDEARDDDQRRASSRRPPSSVPAARITSVTSSRRSLPYMSPRRPMIAVPTDADEQVGGQQPGDAGLGRVQGVLHRRQRGDDRRAEHRVGEPAEREHGEDQRRMRAVGGRRGHS